MPRFASCAVLALVVGGCTQRPADVKAERQALASVICAPNWNLSRSDLEASLSTYFRDDTIIYWPASRPWTLQELLTFGRSWAGDANYAFAGTTTNLDVASSGDLAYCSGAYTARSTDPRTGMPSTDTGYWQTVYRKREGKWVAVTDIHAPDHP